MTEVKPKKKILLLTGWSSAGKDTLGQRLVADYRFSSVAFADGGWFGEGKGGLERNLVPEQSFTRFAFADAVKDKAAEIYRFDRRLADTEEGKRQTLPYIAAGFTVRDALIRYGENEKVAHGKGIWATRLAQAIASSTAEYIVVTDWRFPEELVELQRILVNEAEIFPLRVTRPGQRISPVASLTEYALSGFPMPVCSDALGPLEEVLYYLGVPTTDPALPRRLTGGR